MSAPFFSYAQNMEDYHLSLLFPGRTDGFYIDVGGGHVVADNVTFHFYEKGWRGIVVEPQEALARAYRHVRPRDAVITALAGRAPGEMEFFEADQYHGLSTTVAAHAEVAASKGVLSHRRVLPVTTLAALCATHAPEVIDFLKVDVEGAEADVLAGNDWKRFRPRVIVLEAVAPWSMADASASFDLLMKEAGYINAFFDNLNRFYVAQEATDVMSRIPSGPADWARMRHLGEYGKAPEDPAHPDHALAIQLPGKMISRLNEMDAATLQPVLPAGYDARNERVRAALARIACWYDGGFV